MSVDLTQLFFWPVLVYLIVILLCWTYYLARENAARLVSKQNRIYRCEICEHVYLDARDVPLARCTRCGNLNEAVRM